MNLTESIKQYYKTRNASEQFCIDILSDIFEKIDSTKLLTGENHSHVSNDSILEIILQHKSDSDRIIVFLFQDFFVELHFNSTIRTYDLSTLIEIEGIKNEFLELTLQILDGRFRIIEYYRNDILIKYSYVYDDEFIPDKSYYSKPLGRIRENLTGHKNYIIKEKRAESFLIDEK